MGSPYLSLPLISSKRISRFQAWMRTISPDGQKFQERERERQIGDDKDSEMVADTHRLAVIH